MKTMPIITTDNMENINWAAIAKELAHMEDDNVVEKKDEVKFYYKDSDVEVKDFEKEIFSATYYLMKGNGTLAETIDLMYGSMEILGEEYTASTILQRCAPVSYKNACMKVVEDMAEDFIAAYQDGDWELISFYINDNTFPFDMRYEG